LHIAAPLCSPGVERGRGTTSRSPRPPQGALHCTPLYRGHVQLATSVGLGPGDCYGGRPLTPEALTAFEIIDTAISETPTDLLPAILAALSARTAKIAARQM